MLVIGTFAYFGSGQDKFALELARRFNLPIYSMGEMVKEIAKEQKLRPTRENLQGIRKRLDKQRDRYYLPERLSKRIVRRRKDTIITGIRTKEELEVFRNHFDFYLVFVYADEVTRYERVVRRGEEKDPQSHQEFLDQSTRENDLFDLAYLEEEYDFKIACDMPIDEFRENFEQIAEEVITLISKENTNE